MDGSSLLGVHLGGWRTGHWVLPGGGGCLPATEQLRLCPSSQCQGPQEPSAVQSDEGAAAAAGSEAWPAVEGLPVGRAQLAGICMVQVSGGEEEAFGVLVPC